MMSQLPIINTLDSGLTIGTDYMQDVETVSINFLVKVGSRHETVANNGMSHFLEHMAFKGTASRTAKQIAEQFDMIGADFNAYTGRDKTVYYAKVIKDDVEQALDILTDILQNSLYEEGEIKKEQEVILQEIAQANDTPDDIIFDYFQNIAYPDQPMGRPILGSPEFIKNITRQDIVSYVDASYSLNNIVISAAGKIEHEYFQKLVEAKINNFPKHRKNEIVPAVYKGGDFRMTRDLEQIHLILGLPGLSYMAEDYYTQQVLSIILGGGMSSRLFQEVREKRGLVYGISSFSSSYSDCGMFCIYSSTTTNNVNELLEVVSQEVKKVMENVTEEELQRAKAQVRADLLMAKESTAFRAKKLASNFAMFERYITTEEILEKVNAITKHDISAMMQRLLDSQSKITVAALGQIDGILSYDNIVNLLHA
jgi:predicted Zn-dependent peptidase